MNYTLPWDKSNLYNVIFISEINDTLDDKYVTINNYDILFITTYLSI